MKEGVLGVGEAVVRAKGNALSWDIKGEWESHVKELLCPGVAGAAEAGGTLEKQGRGSYFCEGQREGDYSIFVLFTYKCWNFYENVFIEKSFMFTVG